MSDSELERLRVLADAFEREAHCHKILPGRYSRESAQKALDRFLVASRELQDKYASI